MTNPRWHTINHVGGGPSPCFAEGDMLQTRSLATACFGIASLLVLSVAALAQTSGEGAAAKSGKGLITLGTGAGPPPTVGRAQSSNLLIVNGALYVIDAGDGVTRRLSRFG